MLEIETRSVSRQRDTADLVPGQEQPLAVAKVSTNSGEHLTGHLLTEWNVSQTECLLP